MTSMPETRPLQQSEGSPPQGVASPLGDCSQIAKGDYVEVKVGPVVHLTGHVVDVQPSMDLFWVLTSDGTRKIVELAEFDVYLAA